MNDDFNPLTYAIIAFLKTAGGVLLGAIFLLAILSLASCATPKEINNTYKYIDSVFVHQKDCTPIRPIFVKDSTGNKIYIGNDTTIVKYNIINRSTSKDTTIIQNQPVKTVKETKTVTTERKGFYYEFGKCGFWAICGAIIFLLIKYARNPLKTLIRKIFLK